MAVNCTSLLDLRQTLTRIRIFKRIHTTVLIKLLKNTLEHTSAQGLDNHKKYHPVG